MSLIGLVLALIAILGGNMIEGGHPSALLDLPAFLIVIGGTIGAALTGFDPIGPDTFSRLGL
ncbi:hypothetical protein WM43_21435 [Aeromonas veronii]|uniref:Motility protein A N-terminal domain-containing protein n=1 Tax=Aeromonas veronii TaxID=654 RepID=A0AAC9BB94_AERVE|nr:hypothetical protein WM43_21435 [Aeromonas veronii]